MRFGCNVRSGFKTTFVSMSFKKHKNKLPKYCCIVDDIIREKYLVFLLTVPEVNRYIAACLCFLWTDIVPFCASKFLRTVYRGIGVRLCVCSWIMLCRLWKMTFRPNNLSLPSTTPSPRQRCHVMSSSHASGAYRFLLKLWGSCSFMMPLNYRLSCNSDLLFLSCA